MEGKSGFDDGLLQRITRSGQTFEPLLLSNIGAQYFTRALTDWIIADDFKPFDIESNLLQGILRDTAQRHDPQ